MKWLKRILIILISIPIMCIGGVISFFILFHLFNPWSTSVSLEKDYNSNALFVNDNFEAIFGYKIAVEKMLEDDFDVWKGYQFYDALIYRKQSGNKTWKEVYTQKGEIRKISFDQSSNTLFALGSRANNMGEEVSFLISSQDQGESWSDLSIPENNYSGFDLSCTGAKYLWTDEAVYLFSDTSNIFQQTEIPVEFNMSARSTTTDGDCNLWIEYGNEIVKIGKDSEVEIALVKEDINIDFVNYNPSDMSVWLIGRVKESNKTLLFKRSESGSFEVVKEFPYFLPNALLIESGTVAIPGVNTKNVVSFLGLEKFLYISKNSGSEWEKNEFFYPSFAKEPFFIHKGVVYLSGSMGQIKKRKL